jgi:hypothetical protein
MRRSLKAEGISDSTGTCSVRVRTESARIDWLFLLSCPMRPQFAMEVEVIRPLLRERSDGHVSYND